MKQLLLILAIATSLTSFSQGTISSTISAGTISPTVPDTLVPVKNAILIQPILINALTKDTAYQFIWNVQNISRDTSQGAGAYVNLFDRKGRGIYQTSVYIPKEIIKNWGTSDEIIDNFMINYYKFVPINNKK
jgi:hypothetical protein